LLTLDFFLILVQIRATSKKEMEQTSVLATEEDEQRTGLPHLICAALWQQLVR
jgi:hypothetical protein